MLPCTFVSLLAVLSQAPQSNTETSVNCNPDKRPFLQPHWLVMSLCRCYITDTCIAALRSAPFCSTGLRHLSLPVSLDSVSCDPVSFDSVRACLCLQDWMQYLTGLSADVGAIPLLLCATAEDLPGQLPKLQMHCQQHFPMCMVSVV